MSSAPTQTGTHFTMTKPPITKCPLCGHAMKKDPTVPAAEECPVCGLQANWHLLQIQTERTRLEQRRLDELQSLVFEGKQAERILRTIKRPLE